MKGELSLTLSDGTVIGSKTLEVDLVSVSTMYDNVVKVGISFLTDDAKFVNALLAEIHK